MSDIESDKGSVKWEASPQTPPPHQQQSTQADQQPQITTAAAAASLSPRSSLDLFKRLNLDRFMENNLKLARANYQISEPLNDKAKRPRLVGGEEEEESMESRSTSWSSLDNSCESDNSSSSSSSTALDSTVINSKSKEISSREFGLIDVWLNAFYTSRELVSLDFNIQPRLLSLLEFKADADFPTNIRKTCKAMLANFLLKPIMRIVHFVKMLPDFGDLDPEDQMSLLNGGSMEMFICSATSLYDQISNKLLNLVSREAKTTRSQSLPATSPTAPTNPSLALIQMDILKMIWNEDLFEKTIGFMKSMNELKIDETTLVLLLPIILFSPERTDLKNRQLVYKIQSSYSLLLEKYICWKYGASNDHQCKSEPMQLYNRLLLILIELRSLQEMHSMFLMDVDPSNMEYGSSQLSS